MKSVKSALTLWWKIENDQCIPTCSDDTDKSNEKKESESNFLEMINRGGFAKPSDITFMSCVFAWKHFQQIMNKQKSLFFTSPYPRDTFVHI